MDSNQYKVNKANAYNGWDPLKQVILGNVYEPEFFESVGDSKLRDLLQQILYETHEDLANIRKTLEDLGVEVIQPARNTMDGVREEDMFDTIQDCMDAFGEEQVKFTQKPCLMPRDTWVTMGDKILFTGADFTNPYEINPDIIDHYPVKNLIERDGSGFSLSRGFGTSSSHTYSNEFWAPQIIRVGNKLIIDQEDKPNLAKWVLDKYPQFTSANIAVGGHTDGSMCLPKPGLVIHTPFIDGSCFKETLPGWDILEIQNPNQMVSDNAHAWNGMMSWRAEKDITEGRWWTPEAKSNPELVKFVDSYLNTWVGFAEESIFEVNMLSVSEEVILSLNYQKEVHDKLKKHGMEPIYCRFRHRNFWDGGLHCLTLDTYREGGMQDYFAK